ncbi:MAG: Holliday junction resolvase RuvX [Candidatus Eremiobacteraeota bacterium]|nr:Holliday junction resolvase RuvX [Candidatus Eremiobacteraeota bacterium]
MPTLPSLLDADLAILALDVGTKRIGIALADPNGTFAMPLCVVERVNLRDDISRISEILNEQNASEIVVGDPITLSGERGIAAERIDDFVKTLARTFHGPIHRTDERMTTAQATKGLIASDVSRAKRKHVVDKIAAALILETFLARRKRESSAS